MSPASTSASPSRPVLLPQNRKVRHLRGIYIRNLSFKRPCGRTIDDAAIATTTPSYRDSSLPPLTSSSALQPDVGKSPFLLLHSASSENLSRQKEDEKTSGKKPGVPRRRSTSFQLNLLGGGANPNERQKRLEDVFARRAADVFFSLHVDGEGEPIYISEVGQQATNFNFRYFDLSPTIEPSVTRSPVLKVKVWAAHDSLWSLLLEERVDLRALQWLGSSASIQFSPNALVLHLVDGAYAVDYPGSDVLHHSENAKRGALPPPRQVPPLPTSSHAALMRLATLEASVHDALATRDKLVRQLDELLAERDEKNEAVPAAQNRLRMVKGYETRERNAVAAARRKRDDVKRSIAVRRDAIAEGRAAQRRVEVDVEAAENKLAKSEELLTTTREGIRGQRRRVCEDLSKIFRLIPLPGGPPLAFQICGIPLPSTGQFDTILPSDGDTRDGVSGEDTLSAALGYVALLVDTLQYYLCVPLPYAVQPFGSRSWVRDDISRLAKTPSSGPAARTARNGGTTFDERLRVFPLHVPRGGSSAQFRFEYAWFLLNKDVEALCAAQGLKVVDIRHTLPNLKYLLYVCSAGTDEVPERKRGAVRGLWAGRLASIGLGEEGAEREASAERRETGAGGRDSSAVLKETTAGVRAIELPFRENETKLKLRTKGLRENTVR